MRIKAIKTFICDAFRTNWVFVKVETDEGLHGVGEATLEMREQTVATSVSEIERMVLGRDPRQIEDIWHSCYRDVYFRGGPVNMSALSAVEMALWDIKGKALGVPVYELLGGNVRDSIACYANGWFAGAKTPGDFAQKAEAVVAKGYRGLKWDPFGSAYLDIQRKDFFTAIECVEAVSGAVGKQIEVIVEGHGRFDVPTATRIARALERFDILWFEEPLPPGNLSALADLRARVRVPIAAGERMYSRWNYEEFLRLRCADFIQPDVSHVGGIGELKKVAAMAEAQFLAVCPHNPSGPVANAATLQLAACVPNFHLLETMSSDVPYRCDLTTESVKLENGCMEIPSKPGLGIDIFGEEIAKFPYKPHPLRHYRGDLTDIRPPNAADYDKRQ